MRMHLAEWKACALLMLCCGALCTHTHIVLARVCVTVAGRDLRSRVDVYSDTYEYVYSISERYYELIRVCAVPRVIADRLYV